MRKLLFPVRLLLSASLIVPFAATVLCTPVSLEAQVVSGDLVGVVTDANGAVVPNATVDVTNLATGFKQTQNTTSSGDYHFANLPVGNYSVHVTASGLTGEVPNAQVQLNKTGTVNVALGVAGKQETVEVTATAVTIDTTTPQIQNTFETKQVQDLPVAAIGSGVLNLSLLNAGAVTSGGIGAGSGPSISGQRPRNNNFTVEGVDDNNKSVTGPLLTIPNDAVQNFTVLQNQFSPEFGHSSGGQFNTTIASGTNSFHGRAYDYFQNRNLNALDEQQKIAGQTSQPRYDNNRYGGQIGGPIVKDHLFFFQNVEYNPIGRSTAGFYCAPTAAGYTALNGVKGVSQANLGVVQKYLGTASVVDQSTCPDAPAGAVGKGAAVPFGVGIVQFSAPLFSNNWQYTTSVDFNITQSDQLRFRYSYDKFDGLDTAASLPTFWVTNPSRYHLASLAEFHTFSPTITNEFRFGFNRYAAPTIVGPQTFPGLTVFPNLTFDDLGGVNLGPDGNAPQSTVQNTYQFTDTVSIVHGKHNIKVGAEGRKYISPQQFTQRVRGDYEYASLTDYLQDVAPTTFGERSTGNPVYSANQKAVYKFAHDACCVTS